MDIRQFPTKERFIKLGQTANVVPVCLEMLADLETPVSVLMKLYNKSRRFFSLKVLRGVSAGGVTVLWASGPTAW